MDEFCFKYSMCTLSHHVTSECTNQSMHMLWLIANDTEYKFVCTHNPMPNTGCHHLSNRFREYSSQLAFVAAPARPNVVCLQVSSCDVRIERYQRTPCGVNQVDRVYTITNQPMPTGPHWTRPRNQIALLMVHWLTWLFEKMCLLWHGRYCQLFSYVSHPNACQLILMPGSEIIRSPLSLCSRCHAWFRTSLFPIAHDPNWTHILFFLHSSLWHAVAHSTLSHPWLPGLHFFKTFQNLKFRLAAQPDKPPPLTRWKPINCFPHRAAVDNWRTQIKLAKNDNGGKLTWI